MKWVFGNPDLQMFGLNSQIKQIWVINMITTQLRLWVAVASHTFKWVEI